MEQTISIIVPVYNAEKTLERCVRSLLGQTYENLEILLVNDGSRDESLSLCREYAASDSRIRVIDKPNGGVSSGRNAGLDAARGDFVLFCDSDDWVEPDLCESMLELCRPGDLVICEIDYPGYTEVHETRTEEAPRKEILHHALLAPPPFNKLFIRAAIGNLRFHEELRLGEDFCFVMEYLSRIDGSLRFLYRRLYHYSVDTAGSLSKRAPTIEQCEVFYRYLTAAMEKLGATDPVSMRVPAKHINWHVEMLLLETAERNDWTLRRKFSCAKAIRKAEAYRQCCKELQVEQNPLYLKFYRNGQAQLVLCFLLLRKTVKRYLSH